MKDLADIYAVVRAHFGRNLIFEYRHADLFGGVTTGMSVVWLLWRVIASTFQLLKRCNNNS